MFAFLRRLVWVILICSWSFAVWATPRAGHVIIISIDGGKPAVIKQSKMPVLQKLVSEGACSWTAKTIFPSTTLPSHTSMLTGVGLAKHMIFWNTWQPKSGVVTVPTVFSEAKKAGLSTAMFVGKEKFRHLVQPGTVDCFDYDEKEGAMVTKTVAGAKPEKADSVAARFVARNAARYLVEKKPALCFIHFPDPDDAGHTKGWGSPEQINALEQLDAALGVVMKALDDSGLAGDSVVIVTADHGGHDRTHGLNSPDDMTIPWIAWGKGVKRGFSVTAPITTYDTGVTALWLLDVPLLDSFDGKPVTSAFAQAGG